MLVPFGTFLVPFQKGTGGKNSRFLVPFGTFLLSKRYQVPTDSGEVL